ncbi:uncharacterized protein LOC127738077 isoform X2 [Mytilus californianus]|uniref:uncharacterized protein LOC127738077 isoform X2 n=1 Tax=Mytilus californianus TaxID=6549 RepID=UPI002246661D|nr:uncharacterized protein LOC127738077 isoform X2 [Mytilus californianus]
MLLRWNLLIWLVVLYTVTSPLFTDAKKLRKKDRRVSGNVKQTQEREKEKPGDNGRLQQRKKQKNAAENEIQSKPSRGDDRGTKKNRKNLKNKNKKKQNEIRQNQKNINKKKKAEIRQNGKNKNKKNQAEINKKRGNKIRKNQDVREFQSKPSRGEDKGKKKNEKKGRNKQKEGKSQKRQKNQKGNKRNKGRRKIICSGKKAIVRCRGKRRIKILKAFYGRSDEKICKDKRSQTTGCSAENALSIVQKKCNGVKRCKLQAKENTFGDPCPQTSKYLAVEYACVGRDRKDKKRKLRKLRRARKAKKKQSGSGCRCTASGDVHYYQHSETKVDIQGICKYTLSRSSEAFPYSQCSWNIEVKNERRGSKTTVSYTKLADIYICGTKIAAMQGGAVRVDDFEVSTLSHDVENCGITIRKETGELEVYSSECDITVLWDGRSKLVVDIPKNYSQYGEGICGDCTDRNQFILSDETDISNLPKRERDARWGKEWEVIDDTEEELTGCPASAPIPECTAEQKALLEKDEYCGMLNPKRTAGGESPFADCIRKDVKMANELYEACVIDVCMFLNVPYKKEALCLALDAMAQNCRKNNYDYKEWRQISSCELKCKENSRYKFSSSCPATCDNKNPTDEDCDLPALEGCVCDEGFYLDDNECVEESKCGCIAADNEYYKINAIRRENDCTLEEKCVPGGEMVEVWKNDGCHQNGWCVVKNGNYECECKSNYRGDGREKCDEIPARCVKNERVSAKSGRCKRHRKNKKVVKCTIRSADKIMNVEIVSPLKNRNEQTNKRRERKGKNNKKGKKGKRENKRLKQKRKKNRRNKCRVVGKLKGNRFFTRGNCKKAIFQVTYLSKAGNCENNCGENAILRNGKCKCPKGYTGDPKKKCSDMCMCVSAGDPHIRTMDRAMLHVMGVCKYILSALKDTSDPCAYMVETTTEKRNSRPVSYNKRVDFTIGNVVYSILKGSEVMIDGELVSVPQNLDEENIVITREERSIVIRHTKCEIDVSFDGRHKVMVQAPYSAYSGRVTGMCGNCNRDREDDYYDRDGNLSKKRALHNRIGKSWNSPGQSCPNETPLVQCTDKATIEAKKRNRCGLLDSQKDLFKIAFKEGLDLSGYYESCVFDVCENPDTALHCPILEEAVFFGSQNGIRIDLTEWRDVTNCPLKCAETFVKSDSVTCIPSCMDTEADKSSDCTTAPFRGCTCESGKVDKGDRCVQESECVETCSVMDGKRIIMINVGETFPMNSECGSFSSCIDVEGTPTTKETVDSKCPGENKQCGTIDGSRVCECAEGYERDTDIPLNCKKKPAASPTEEEVPSIDGGWTEYGEWSPCTKSCGPGERVRTKTCTNPAPANGGKMCEGRSRETESCYKDECPVDGGWTEYGEWSPCTKSCGTGERSRTRTCTSPSPAYGGKTCDGKSQETESCNTDECPVDGGWTEYGEWSPCTKSCGPGERVRTRTCTSPTPANGGKKCDGRSQETESCYRDECPVDGGWTDYGEWSPCTKSCGTGERFRTRTCTSPAPAYGGKKCDGGSQEKESCNTVECPVTLSAPIEPEIPDFEPNFPWTPGKTPESNELLICSVLAKNSASLFDESYTTIGNPKEACSYKAPLTKYFDSYDVCSFDVSVSMGIATNPKMRYLKFSTPEEVVVNIRNYKIVMGQDKSVKVNGKNIKLPYTDDKGYLFITYIGGRLQFSHICGLIVMFNRHAVDVLVPKTYGETLDETAICGSSKKHTEFVPKTTECVGVVNCRLPPFVRCQDFPDRKEGPFTKCSQYITTNAKQHCGEVSCGLPSITCDLSHSYMTRCAIRMQDKPFTYWSTTDYTATCPKPTCEPAQHKTFKDSTTACPATLADPNAPKTCVLPNVSICACDDGYAWEDNDFDNGKCVPVGPQPLSAPEPETQPPMPPPPTPQVQPTRPPGPPVLTPPSPTPQVQPTRPPGPPVLTPPSPTPQLQTTRPPGPPVLTPPSPTPQVQPTRPPGPPVLTPPAPTPQEQPTPVPEPQEFPVPRPVNGGWSEYGLWGKCSKTCGGGMQSRTRICNNPAPSEGGKVCEGSDEETQPCRTDKCPGDCSSTSECHADGVCDNGRCKCKENFRGNGYSACKQICFDSKCARFASCKNGKCRCNRGYVGRGQRKCKLKCGKRKCHAEAKCQKKKCVCNSEFPYGNGINRCSETCKGKKCVKDAVCPRNKCVCKKGYYGIRDKSGELTECRKLCRRKKCDRDATCKGRGWNKDCVCNSGFIGNGKSCQEKCTCAAFGDPTILRYSYSALSFAGECKYTLSKLLLPRNRCMFNVEVNYDKGNKKSESASSVSFVELNMYGISVQLGPKLEVRVDRELVSLPYRTKNRSLFIRYMGLNVLVETKCSVELQWNEAGMVILSVPKKLGNRVEGLCGQCNGKKNEWLLKDKTDVSKDSLKFSKIGDSFAVATGSESCKTSETPTCKVKDRVLKRTCGFFKKRSFKKCASANKELVEILMAACRRDYCANYKDKPVMKEVSCRSEHGFYTMCHYYGFGGIRWRSGKCKKKKCDRKTERWAVRATACPNNCVQRNIARKCFRPKIEDCVCRNGHIRSGDKCVKLLKKKKRFSNCGCEKNGRYIKSGELLRSKDCRTEFTCKPGNKRGSLKKTKSNVKCHREGYCGIYAGERSCVCLPSFLGNGIDSCTPARNCDFKEDTENCVNTIRMKGECFYRSIHNNQCKYHVMMGKNNFNEDITIASFKTERGLLKKQLKKGDKFNNCAKVSLNKNGYVTIVEKICECPKDHPLNS